MKGMKEKFKVAEEVEISKRITEKVRMLAKKMQKKLKSAK